MALTADIERRALIALARRLHAGIRADHLTVLGVLAAVATGIGYVLSAHSVHWLWLASAGLVVNWFGDSLDGTVARVRDQQRPRYGYYLDHAVDAFTTTVIGLGLGLSPFVSLWAGAGIVILYLLMSINVYLESKVLSLFQMDYGLIGPTEVRLILIALNTVAIGVVAGGGLSPRTVQPWADLFMAAVLVGMTALLVRRFFATLSRLDREDPAPRP